MAFSASGVTHRPDLMETVMEGMGGADRVQAHRGLFTLTPVDLITGDYGLLTREEAWREAETEVSRRSGYNRGDVEFGQLFYSCKKYGFEHAIIDDDLARFGVYGLIEQRYAEMAMRRMLVGEAKRAVALTFENSGLALTGLTGLSIGNEWDDYSAADPIADVFTGIDAINTKSGAEGPDMTLALHWRTLLDITRCDTVQESFKYTGELRDYTDYQRLASVIAPILGVGQIQILGVPTNAKPSGVAGVITQLWDREFAWMGVVAPAGSLTAETANRLFYYEGEGMGGLEALETYENLENDERAIVRARQCVELKAVDLDLAFRFGNVYTAA